MQVKWLRKELHSLDDEATYIASDDANAARVLVARVLDAVAMLAEQPGLGRTGRVPGTRELVVDGTGYIVPYRVRGQTTEILRAYPTPRAAFRSSGRPSEFMKLAT